VRVVEAAFPLLNDRSLPSLSSPRRHPCLRKLVQETRTRFLSATSLPSEISRRLDTAIRLAGSHSNLQSPPATCHYLGFFPLCAALEMLLWGPHLVYFKGPLSIFL